jgi:hypothetical protein
METAMAIALLQLSKIVDGRKPNLGLTKDQQEFLEWVAQQEEPIDIEQMFAETQGEYGNGSKLPTIDVKYILERLNAKR